VYIQHFLIIEKVYLILLREIKLKHKTQKENIQIMCAKYRDTQNLQGLKKL